MLLTKFTVIHPFIFAIFPIIHLYSINFFDISINEIAPSILISVLITGILFILLKLILKDWIKSGLIISLLLFFTFTYGHFYNLLNIELLGDLEIGRHRYLMVVFLVIFIIGIIAIVKTQIKLDNLTKIITAIAITLILITIPSFVYAVISTSEIIDDIQPQKVDEIQSQNPRITYELKNVTKLNSIEKPDVYYIILAGYGGTKSMKQDLNFDN